MPPTPSIKIGPIELTQGGPTLVIAEAGVNHNGDPALAKQLVTAAKNAGADAVKFQAFNAQRLAAHNAPKAQYQKQTTDPCQSQLDMLRRLELSHDQFRQIAQYCQEQQILFLATPYNHEDIDFLDSLNVPAYKVASGQAVEPLFLKDIAQRSKPVILSTGMCTQEEVAHAVHTLRTAGNEQLIALQCTTDYPAAVADANLLAMVTMRDELGVLTGYSDHTTTHTAAVAAVALGACVIEKHLTTDKALPGPDHACSCDPDQFAHMVRMIRETTQALGSPVKAPTPAELRNLPQVRRGVVAKARITAGSPLTPNNLTVKRPTTTINADRLPDIIGRLAAVDIEPDTPITPEMIK